jgi:Leucine Rich Repeat (LRR) protein
MTANIDQHTRLAEDLVAAYNSSEAEAVARLNRLFHSSINADQIRHFVRDRLMFLPGYEHHAFDLLTLADAQQLFASLHGFKDWAEFVLSSNQPPRDPRSTPLGLSSTPPFYRIDWAHKSIEPRQPMSNKDWEHIYAVVKELGLTTINAINQIGDDDLEKLSQLDHVTSLDFSGSQFISDEGLQHLERMPQLRELRVSQYPGGGVTDRGLEVLQRLPELRVFEICWQSGITDKGISNLRHCEQLEDVDLMGTHTGDGAIAALTGKPKLRKFKTGRNVTDEGLALLHQFPAFKMWSGGEPKYGLMSFSAEPTNLLIDGPFTRRGLASLSGLDGLFGLSFFRHTSNLRGDDLQALPGLPNLAFFGCPGDICDDDAMRHISALTNLRMLMAQGTVATDDGFKSLSRCETLEFIWGRECPNLKNAGFTALAEMPALRGLAVSCKFVDDTALAKLPAFPALKELMPMDISDEGFRHVGRCHQLESLVLMYCRDTTDAATEQIQALPNLKKYHAGYTPITDRTLELLSAMRSLKEVSFEGCKWITDAGLASLAGLPLREISVGNCPRVTRAGLSAFPATVKVNYSPH